MWRVRIRERERARFIWFYLNISRNEIGAADTTSWPRITNISLSKLVSSTQPNYLRFMRPCHNAGLRSSAGNRPLNSFFVTSRTPNTNLPRLYCKSYSQEKRTKKRLNFQIQQMNRQNSAEECIASQLRTLSPEISTLLIQTMDVMRSVCSLGATLSKHHPYSAFPPTCSSSAEVAGINVDTVEGLRSTPDHE